MRVRMDSNTRKNYERMKPESMQFEVYRKTDSEGEYTQQFKQARVEVVDEIYDALKENGYNLDKTTVFMGGTSNLLKEEIIEKFGKKATFLGDTLEELQYVNAEGFYTYIKE